MGAICGKVETQGESRKEVEEDLRIDNRKRNSLIFAVIEWVSAVDANNSVKDQEKLATIIARRPRDTETATDDPRASRQTKESEAIAGGNFRALRGILISEWRFVNRKYPNLNDDTLLHIACREGYLRMVQFITDPKNQPQFENVELDVNLENGKWRTPLHVAFTPPVETFCARRFGVDSKGLPLAKKPDGDVSDMEWIRPGTARTRAEDRQKIVACLIKRKCDLNKVDYHDHSALHYACVWGWVPTVDLLLEEGADPECSNIGALAASCGQNALMLCADFLHVPLIDLLLSETEISIESKNVDGETALHYAALRGSMEAVEALLEFGANVNCESYARDTPLKRACRQQRVDLVHKLLDYDCNRRPSAFAILEGEALMEITLRLDEEKRKKVEEYEKLKRLEAAGKNKKGKKSAIGAWVPYRDKRGRGIFYYNRVSRVSQFEVPEDYEKDRRYLMKDATYGMHFYH
ncbi:unnamed protein product [Pelagomonas calceolata]|uniref:WW domain-containing protein n=1 Tax=Pelagomonas calceolata TaxID=35677 RepID=A0A8J2X0P4_9STRA|nr:unnamed protein product [Pelagomonas calceolata]